MHPCRVALQAAAASPAAAHLTARCFTAEGLLFQKADSPGQVAGGSETSLAASSETSSAAGSETSLATHVANMVCIVGRTAQACWLAVSEEEKLRPAHYQALLDTFLYDGLCCRDTPEGLRQGSRSCSMLSCTVMQVPALLRQHCSCCCSWVGVERMSMPCT